MSGTKPKGQNEAVSRAQNVRRAITQIPELVRVESNLDAQPIWAPSSYAEEKERTYPLKWRGEGATVSVQSSGKYGMLRSFDKLVLTAMVHLWNSQGRQEDGRVYFQIIDIINALGRKSDGRLYQQLKDSLHRLRGCLVQYQLSFFDASSEEWVSLRDKTILSDLLVVEPRKEATKLERESEGFTFAELDFTVVGNLLGNFTRPVSLQLLQSLTERGVLFESYVNAVLYRNSTIRKDVYELWHDLGLSTTGIDYGSQLASRMKKDLDKIAADDTSLLGSYSFEKSKTRSRSQNLVLLRAKNAVITAPNPKFQKPRDHRQRVKAGQAADCEKLVEWMKHELHDVSSNDTNLRVIAAKMPESLVRTAVDEAYGRYRDGLVNNPTAYFVGVMKREAQERGINLGLPERDPSKPLPKKVSRRQPQENRSGELSDLTAQLANKMSTGGSK